MSEKDHIVSDVKGMETAAIVADEAKAKASRQTKKRVTATQQNAVDAAAVAEARAEAAEAMASEARKKAEELRKEADKLNPAKVKKVKAVKEPSFAECNAQYFKQEAQARKGRDAKKQEVQKAIDKIYGGKTAGE
jgi:membrane protein involved in colicin uptake